MIVDRGKRTLTMKGFGSLADYGELPLCDDLPAGFVGAAMVDRYTDWTNWTDQADE